MVAHSGGTMEYATAPTATTNTHVYSSNTTFRCECPNVKSRWCRCFLSALNGDCPLRTRRTTAITRSSSGTATAANTTMMGDNNATMSTAPYSPILILPLADVDAAASRNPMSMEPESPMKIRDGSKLCGRKPAHTPTNPAAMIAGGYADTMPP